MEPQSEQHSDISANSCTAHTGALVIVEVTSWGRRSANSQLQSSTAQMKVCMEAADDSEMVIGINEVRLLRYSPAHP